MEMKYTFRINFTCIAHVILYIFLICKFKEIKYTIIIELLYILYYYIELLYN